jgi:hypothetical protein
MYLFVRSYVSLIIFDQKLSQKDATHYFEFEFKKYHFLTGLVKKY